MVDQYVKKSLKANKTRESTTSSTFNRRKEKCISIIIIKKGTINKEKVNGRAKAKGVKQYKKKGAEFEEKNERGNRRRLYYSIPKEKAKTFFFFLER